MGAQQVSTELRTVKHLSMSAFRHKPDGKGSGHVNHFRNPQSTLAMTYGRASTPGAFPLGQKTSDPGVRIGQIGDHLLAEEIASERCAYAPLPVRGSRGILFIRVPHDRRPIIGTLDRNGRTSREVQAVGAGPECPLPVMLQEPEDPSEDERTEREFISVHRERGSGSSRLRWFVLT